MGRKKYLLTAALLGVAVLTGCGGNDNASDESGNGTKDADAAQGDASDYDVDDYVTLGEYKNLTVKYPIPEVTDEDLEMYIEEQLDENTEYKDITDRAAKEGDSVNINFTGTVDGEEFEGGSGEDYDLVLGSGDFLEDFENSLIGKKSGETVTFKVTFPDDYDTGDADVEAEGDETTHLSGKEAEFTVTINSIQEVVVPEYNEEFVKNTSEYKTVEEYEKAAKEELMVTMEEESLATARDSALALAVENATLDGYPKALYDSVYAETEESYKMFEEYFGMEFSEEEVAEAALSDVNERMVIQAIAKEEGIEVTEEEVKTESEAVAAENEYDSVESLEADYGKNYVRDQLLREKVIDCLYDSAKIEEVSSEEYYAEEEEAGETEEE